MNAHRHVAVLILATLAVLAGCSSSGPRKGAYYKDDGPGANPPADVANIPDAVPRIEAYNPSNSRAYFVFGRRYVPVSGSDPLRQKGVASWYGKKFQGRQTANGEIYDMYAMTAAHPTLPLPSYARVTRVATGQSIVVRINDRGPFHGNRIIDLSYAAAAKLGIVGKGSDTVVVQAITHDDIRRGLQPLPEAAPPAATLMAAEESPSASDLIDEAIKLAAGTEPQENDSAGVYLQFGAFSGSHNAEQLALRLNRDLASEENRLALIEESDALHKVRMGPFPDRTAAVNAAWRIEQLTGVQPTIALR